MLLKKTHRSFAHHSPHHNSLSKAHVQMDKPSHNCIIGKDARQGEHDIAKVIDLTTYIFASKGPLHNVSKTPPIVCMIFDV